MKFQQFFGFLFLAVIFPYSLVEAQTQYRGFNVVDNMSSEDIAQLGTWNVNLVRKFCRAPLDGSSENSAQFAARVQNCITSIDGYLPLYAAEGIKMIIVLDPPAPIYVAGVSRPQQYLFSSADLQAQFKQAWQTLAQHYAANSDILGFDLLNEPAPPKKPLTKWGNLATELVATIRSAGATQKIYIESEFGNPTLNSAFKKACDNLKPLGYSNNLIFSVHFYSPFDYTHQGFASHATGVSPPSSDTQKKLRKILSAAQRGANKCGGKLFLGEFGKSQWAQNGRSYFDFLLGYAELKGWDWAYNAYDYNSGWDPRLGPSDDLNALIEYFVRNN